MALHPPTVHALLILDPKPEIRQFGIGLVDSDVDGPTRLLVLPEPLASHLGRISRGLHRRRPLPPRRRRCRRFSRLY